MRLAHLFRKKSLILIAIIMVLIIAIIYTAKYEAHLFSSLSQSKTKLPEPVYTSNTSIEQALKSRRSIRQYKNEAISLQQISQLLWAAQGITSPNGFRTAPSAGALYPLEIYLVSGNVRGLPSGVYHYLPANHALELLFAGDKRQELANATLKQDEIKNEAADIIIAATFAKTTAKYEDKGKQFVYMEAGHAAENIYLQAVSLGIGTVSIGAFDDSVVKMMLKLPQDMDPLYIMPVGKI